MSALPTGGGGPTNGPGSPGPRVVALGGGHGLAVTLRALSGWAGEVTAIVSVADDGGSSGRLRQVWDGPAPGDVRRCLLSLADEESLWSRVFEYRFPAGDLAGHSLGNLLLVGLTEATGSFIDAVESAARLLGVGARVLPATEVPVDLKADVGGVEIHGQVNVMHARGPIRSVSLLPPDPAAPRSAVEAVVDADMVVIGPGSLFTSVLATCVVPGLREALASRSGGRVYVCNLRPQNAETAGFDANDHLAALAAHGVPVDAVICDPATAVGAPSFDGSGPTVVEAPLARSNGHAHDPAQLGAVLRRMAAQMGRL